MAVDITALLAMTPAERRAAAEARLFTRHGQACRHYGHTVAVRHVSFYTAPYRQDDYLQELRLAATFLLSQGGVQGGDEFETGAVDNLGRFIPDGRRFCVTAPLDRDDSSVSFVIAEC